MTGERIVRDTTGLGYRVGERVGGGGQGEVFRAQALSGAAGPSLLVKLVGTVGSVPEAARLAFERATDQLMRMQLDDVGVVGPARRLVAPDIGYVMEFLGNMEPLERLWMTPEDMTPMEWFFASGGFRKRLAVLARLADALGELHARGWVYGDVSPSNLFIESGPDGTNARLIDADNIRWRPDFTVATPDYAAPEIFSKLFGEATITRSGASSLSDAWSFACVVVRTLLLEHPFNTEAAYESRDGDAIQRCVNDPSVPWIWRKRDPPEPTGRGLPPAAALDNILYDLADRTFDAGRSDPMRRPGVGAWADALHAAAGYIVVCPACGADYYVKWTECMMCPEPRPALIVVSTHLFNPARRAYPGAEGLPETAPETIDRLTVAAGGGVAEMTRRFTEFAGGVAGQERSLALEADGRALSLTPYRAGFVARQKGGGDTIALPAAEPSALTTAYDVHAGAPDEPHKVLRFRFHERAVPPSP